MMCGAIIIMILGYLFPLPPPVSHAHPARRGVIPELMPPGFKYDPRQSDEQNNSRFQFYQLLALCGPRATPRIITLTVRGSVKSRIKETCINITVAA